MENHLADFLSSLEQQKHFAPNTISAYRNDLTQLSRYLTSNDATPDERRITSWRQLQAEHLMGFLENLRASGYARATIARKSAALKSFVGYLSRVGLVEAGISDHLVSPPVDRFVPVIMSRDETARLLQEPTRTGSKRPESLRDRAMLQVLYHTGMRVGELVALNVNDLDDRKRNVRCVGHAGRVRSISLPAEAAKALDDYLSSARTALAARGEKSLFVNHRGTRLTRQGFWLIIKSHASRAGIEGITPHTLRHTFAMHAIEDGVPVKVVQKTLGHVSPSTTNVYRDLIDRREAAKA